MTDEQLSALLRLKRFEQPPADYFDDLLREIQRRQRTELLRRPLWKIAVERVQTFFGEHSMGNLSYAGALATVLVVGVGAIGLITPTGTIENAGAPTLASATAPAAQSPSISPASDRLLTLQASQQRPVLATPSLTGTQPGYESLGSQPRYIMDARPVSYEPSSSFNF